MPTCRACRAAFARSLIVRGALLLSVLLTSVAAPAQTALPADVIAALRAADITAQDMVALVEEVGRGAPPRLAWQIRKAVNPASLMKLWPTYAALELLGPDWRWKTPVWLDGNLPAPVGGGAGGVFDGDVVIRGSGDPTLVVERIWLMWRRLQQLGVREIGGDIVLDRSAFADPPIDPAAFDNEPLRPYNVQSDALLLNLKALHIGFIPEPGRGIARLSITPPLDGWKLPASLPLSAGPCGDWREQVQADFSNPGTAVLRGSFPAACGERQWALADADPAGFNARMLSGLWRELGGRLGGRVRDGSAPPTTPSFELSSAPLADVVRDINKYSNNVMAQQLFLSLPLMLRGDGSAAAARALLRDWATPWLADEAATLLIDNGSGLSRDNRVSALAFARLLQRAWSGPLMAELIASLPASGLGGTLRRSTITPGRAHLKTGSLRDVAAVAGYVLADDGRRYVLVAIINHPNANAARPALDLLAQWAIRTPPH